ncbi:response regulator [Herbaspirillum sp. YR522]|uniref:response regulator n=1 Tax=Herbaspirillum sp. YR522 TaxID=1144342 RepID=UPI00026F8867|nr:response regulator [Herbaspirillum sp. YR522]EJN02876.1 response regulator containing a CheY-like receiver domain and a GGDEF domain [Herbaspirillum sp. YR522]
MINSTLRAKRKILVADDSSAVRHNLSRLLGDAGYDVLTAANGIEALAQLGAQHVDLVICDADMAPLDGRHICMLIRRSARHAGLPVVMLSARERPFDSARSAMAGADQLLGKPVNETVLLQITRAHVDGVDAV